MPKTNPFGIVMTNDNPMIDTCTLCKHHTKPKTGGCKTCNYCLDNLNDIEYYG